MSIPAIEKHPGSLVLSDVSLIFTAEHAESAEILLGILSELCDLNGLGLPQPHQNPFILESCSRRFS